MTYRFARQVPLLVMLLALAACGGGGGAGGNPSNDITPPVATLTAPANLAVDLPGSLTVSASATDDVGVATLEIQVDGVAIGAVGAGATHSVVVDTTAYASGQHVLRARATDAAGNPSAWASATVTFGGTRLQPAGFANETWITGLTSATAFAQTPDGRLLVAQQGGALRVIQNNTLLTTPMLLLANVDPNGERGLLGVAVHPNFAVNGYIYTYHTTTEGGTHNRITRYTVTGNLAGGAVPLVNLPALSGATNHNGGALHFGNDGKLYVGVGDNANGASAPDQNSLFGKMLRFNDDGSIPNDNPFCTTPSNLSCAVWARGLRNPFTFAVNPANGRIHINDVGESTWEEVNLGVAGANYGWPATEGPPNGAAGVTAPLFAYQHSATTPPGSGAGGFVTGCSIIGGAFYPSSGNFPAAYRGGSYFFSDLCSRRIYRMDTAASNAVYVFGQSPLSPVGMLVGQDGALYVLAPGGIQRFRAL